MKIYEKLGIDPLTSEGMLKIMNINCTEIPDELGKALKDGKKCPKDLIHSCAECKAERLFAEVQMKKVKRGTTYTDFYKAYDDYYNTENRNSTPHAFSFCKWLSEESEVEE